MCIYSVKLKTKYESQCGWLWLERKEVVIVGKGEAVSNLKANCFFLDKKHPFMKSSFSFYHIALQSALFGFHCLRHISQVPRGILLHSWLGTLTRDLPEECHHGLQLPLAFPECNQLLAATLSPENCNRF